MERLEKLGATKDCEECPTLTDFIELDYDNKMNLKIWTLVCDQEEVGFDGTTSLKLDIVLKIIELFYIPKCRIIETLTIIKNCWAHFSKKRREESDKRENTQRNKKVLTKNIKRK